VLARFDVARNLAAADLREGAIAGSAHEQLRYHPLGVVAVIGPYNYPIHLCHAHVVPALLTRQHRRRQAVGHHAAGRAALRRDRGGRRPAARRVQPGARHRRGRRGAGRRPTGQGPVLHRQLRGRPPHPGGRPRSARALGRPRDGRQEHGDRLRRRQRPPGRSRDPGRRLPVGRSALHRHLAGPGPGQGRGAAPRRPAPGRADLALRSPRRRRQLRRAPGHGRWARALRARPGGRRRRRRRAGDRRRAPTWRVLPDRVAPPLADRAPRRRRLHRRRAVRPGPRGLGVHRRRRGDRGGQRLALRLRQRGLHQRRSPLRAHLPRDHLGHPEPQPLDQPGEPAAALRRRRQERQLPAGGLDGPPQRRSAGRGAGQRDRHDRDPPDAGRSPAGPPTSIASRPSTSPRTPSRQPAT
jgi:hypothetical protein